jgi:hypothetical protein
MLITVPRSIQIDPSYFGDMNELVTFGLSGLGDPCDPTASDYDMSACLGSAPTIAGTTPVNDVGILPSAIPTGPSLTTAPTSSTLAQDLTALGPLLSSAAKSAATLSGPYQIPNTSYIYNPATGQILFGGSAVGTFNPATGAISPLAASSLSSYMPLALGVFALLAVVMVMRPSR